MMKAYSIGFSLFLSSLLSAQILTFTTTGDYTLKNGESEDHGYRIATELAKQVAIERAGTAVVSSFKIERNSEGKEHSSLKATTYAAALVKSTIVSKKNDNGYLSVVVTSSLDDSRIEDYLKSGPALHEKMAELQESNEGLKEQLTKNLKELQEIDDRYTKSLSGGVSKEEIALIKEALSKKIEDTDRLLQSLGEYQTKTGHLFVPSGSLLKTAIKQQLNTTQIRYEQKVMMGAVDAMLNWFTQNVKVAIDPKSIKVTNGNGTADISFVVDSIAENKDYAQSPYVAALGKSGIQLAMHEFPYYSVFADDTKEVMRNTQLRLPYMNSETKTIKDGSGKSFQVRNPHFVSIPWSKFARKSKREDFKCSSGLDEITKNQCELNRYALSKTLVVRVGIQGTEHYVDIPLHKVKGQNDYFGKLTKGVEHTLSVSDSYSAIIKGVPMQALENADDFYTKILVINSKDMAVGYDEMSDLDGSNI